MLVHHQYTLYKTVSVPVGHPGAGEEGHALQQLGEEDEGGAGREALPVAGQVVGQAEGVALHHQEQAHVPPQARGVQPGGRI